MERFGLDDHEAFMHLAKQSQINDVKLRDIATHLVERANELRHSKVEEGPDLLFDMDPAERSPGGGREMGRTELLSMEA